MLKKANRLRSQWDFKRTLAGQRIGANDCFAVYGLSFPLRQGEAMPPSPPGFTGRIGFVISKKVHKRATRRNRIRRRLREILRLWLLSDDYRPLLTRYRCLVIIARSGSVTASYRDLEQRMRACFRIRLPQPPGEAPRGQHTPQREEFRPHPSSEKKPC